ncbi:MAG: nucleotide sugar dehydrogenase [bacterium]
MNDLLEKIRDKSAKIGVIGLGYVGLPLVTEFAEAGFTIIGFDLNRQKINRLNKGESYIDDVSDDLLSRHTQNGRIVATDDFGRLAEVDAISICVPTPLSKTGDPDVSYIDSAVNKIVQYGRKGQLIVLESTTYPGTTREQILPRLINKGLTVGRDFFLAFSPERIDPGNPRFQTRNIPKIVGGVEENSGRVARVLYQNITRVIPVSNEKVAETAKLLENIFRSVNIALANEIALVCDKLEIDVWEVIDAAATKPFGFMPFYPGPGLGGHCIPVDPSYLSWKMRSHGYEVRFIELARSINKYMPLHVIYKVAAALNQSRKCLNGSRILVIGVAYKPDVDDYRESPSFDIIDMLTDQGAHIEYHDPHIREIKIKDETLQSVPLSAEQLSQTDCALILTGHKAVDYELLLKHAPVIMDTRNAMKDFPDPKIIKL